MGRCTSRPYQQHKGSELRARCLAEVNTAMDILYLRLRQQLTSTGKQIAGVCSSSDCQGCTWKLLATPTLLESGAQHLWVQCAGAHGARAARKGTRLWTVQERHIIAEAFPNKATLSCKLVRDASARAGLQLVVSNAQLTQYVARENRDRQGNEAATRKPLVQELGHILHSWQTASFAGANLKDLRLVGESVCSAGRIFFAWTCRVS